MEDIPSGIIDVPITLKFEKREETLNLCGGFIGGIVNPDDTVEADYCWAIVNPNNVPEKKAVGKKALGSTKTVNANSNPNLKKTVPLKSPYAKSTLSKKPVTTTSTGAKKTTTTTTTNTSNMKAKPMFGKK
mmetsp:Transcript_20497/g.17883  ORF Transcript_20497/g.17883 Transcript_20497/m.17883 type:complete len:131 (-) Transcript_20497:111-503(-)